MLKFPVRPINYAEVRALAEPQKANQPEVIPWTYFDTQSLASNWTAQSFFATPQTDKTLGNIEQGGTIPADTFFQIWAFNVDFLIPAYGNTATPEIANDVLQILYGARATLNFSIASKVYAQTPLTFLHGSGGARLSVVNSNATAATIVNHAQAEIPDGGFWVDGSIILPPNQSFTLSLTGTAAVLNATRSVRISMVGVKYRPVR